MTSPGLEPIVEGFRKLYAGWGRETTIQEMRQQWDAFLSQVYIPAATEDVFAGDVGCRWVARGGARRNKVILYLHGGGYQIGSLRSHHNVMARLSEASGSHVLGVDYRLAPEHRFPAPLEDALTAYQWLLQEGMRACDIAVCGDSAGGGLAVAALTALRDRQLPLPAAIVAMSPWVDMEAAGNSYATRAGSDPVTQRATIQLMVRAYMGKAANVRDPRASPIHADLAGLPPLLIHVGEREVLFDDACALERKAEEAGVEVKLRVWKGMIHTFQLFTGRLDEADAAIREAAEFLKNKLARPVT
jgi:monoterpene epsilon-lactone hydrolase